MPRLFEPLSLSAQTNFAELQEQVQARLLRRTVAGLTGSFNRKRVGSSDYWYWQARDLEGRQRQVYLGPDDERLRRLIAARDAGNASAQTIPSLVRACRQLGCQAVLPQHGRVIARLEEQAFFAAGGVLIGTHAFIAMSNMLGVRWTEGFRTNDIDFAHAGRNLSVALPTNIEIQVHDAITSLEMGLQPARSMTTGEGATYFNASGDLRVDLLTPQGRTQHVYRHEQLGVNLQPLRFMEFSLADTTQTIILHGEDAVLVNIPAPMRYALHKMLVMAEREEQFRVKIAKDAAQVAALLQWGIEYAPASLEAAATDIMSRGKGWQSRVMDGLEKLRSHHADVAGSVEFVLESSRNGARPKRAK